MIISKEVTLFLLKLKKEGFTKASEFISKDIKELNESITNHILDNGNNFTCNWLDYTLSDMNMGYEENVLKIVSMLEKYNAREILPTFRASDKIVYIKYRFDAFDAYNRTMSTIIIFTLIVKSDDGTIAVASSVTEL